jgi:tetratricopeptide (TPR) repeat protein
LGDYQRAIDDFNQAIQLDPLFANAYKDRGIAQLELGEYARAVEDFDQAVQINPQDAEAYYNVTLSRLDNHKGDR